MTGSNDAASGAPGRTIAGAARHEVRYRVLSVRVIACAVLIVLSARHQLSMNVFDDDGEPE
jgi:hypothetical protein